MMRGKGKAHSQRSLRPRNLSSEDFRSYIARTAGKLLTDSTHSFDHAERVWRLCRRIGMEEGADLGVLFASSYLHDMTYSRDHKSHERSSAALARKVLAKTKFPKEKIPLVLECIRRHRFSKNHPPETIEQKILQDADKLDAMGAVGIARCFLWTGERKLPMKIALDHFPEKLLKLKERMNTRSAKRLADARHSYMLSYLRRFSDEQRGIV